MKRIIICAAAGGLGLLAWCGCQSSSYDQASMTHEPAGAFTTNAPETQARDINQQPYPGNNPFATPEHPYPDR